MKTASCAILVRTLSLLLSSLSFIRLFSSCGEVEDLHPLIQTAEARGVFGLQRRSMCLLFFSTKFLRVRIAGTASAIPRPIFREMFVSSLSSLPQSRAFRGDPGTQTEGRLDAHSKRRVLVSRLSLSLHLSLWMEATYPSCVSLSEVSSSICLCSPSVWKPMPL